MKKIILKTLLLGVTAVLVFVSCDTTSSENGINDPFDLDNTIYSLTGGIVTLYDIPPEYDSIGMAFGEYLTTVSLSIIDKGIENPTMDDIKHAAKKFFIAQDVDFDTAVINAFDPTEIIDADSVLNFEQQKVLAKINMIDQSVFEDQIPIIASLVNTLPEDEREPLFIYASMIKHRIIAGRTIATAILTLPNHGIGSSWTEGELIIHISKGASIGCSATLTAAGSVWAVGIGAVTGPWFGALFGWLWGIAASYICS